MANGGKRPGAGRKFGSKSRPSIFDYWDDGEIATFFEFLKDNYKEDMRLMQWVGDHLMGKPQQNIDHTTLGEKLPTPILTTVDVSSDDGPKKD
jgi:hypothetical protein